MDLLVQAALTSNSTASTILESSFDFDSTDSEWVDDIIDTSRLTDYERWTCIILHDNGFTNVSIAEKLDISRNTVAAVIKRFQKNGSPNSGSRSGRPRKTSPVIDRRIVQYAKKTIFTTPLKIKRKLELSLISQQTVRRRVAEKGLFGRVVRFKRDYSESEIQKRLSFATGYKNWTPEQWEKVIFSDEKSFYGAGYCGRQWCLRPVGEAFNPKYTLHKIAHPVTIGIWGCFSAHGPGYISCYKESLTAPLQKQILDDNLLATAIEHNIIDAQWYFLHDNARTFKAVEVQNWIFSRGVTCMDFPPYSPDLNPIENLWAWFTQRVNNHDVDTWEKLQDAVSTEWEKMRDDPYSLQYLKTLAHSMPNRCKAVIDAKGWHTKY